MDDMKEQIKIALLTIIAGTLIVQIIMTPDGAIVVSEPEGQSSTSSPLPATTLPQSLNNTPNPLASQITEIEKPKGPITSMIFDSETHDFGTIKQNSTDNKYTFTFTNTGTNPLIISNAKGSCGCTVPKWPKEPIPPGGTGTIEVDYKPGSQKGNQKKTVTVTANTEPADTRLAINAVVEEVAE